MSIKTYKFFLTWTKTDVGTDMSTPEPDEISGSSSSTHDVYSDVMGVLVRTSQQQQPHQEIPIGTALSSSSVLAELLPGHSRNSSGTSHSGSGSASGYGSLASQSQHSRQSSSGELGHFRLAFVFLCAHFSAYCRVDRMVVASLLIWLLLYSLLFVSFFSFSFRCCLFDLGLCFFFFFFFCLHEFFGFPLPFFVHLTDAACVDFRPGPSGRHASPSFACLSAEALASLAPLCLF